VEALRSAEVEAIQLHASSSCAKDKERELANLHSKICRLRSEVSPLHAECDGARGDMDHLQDEGSRLKETPRGVKSRIELAKSSSWEVEVRLVQPGSELTRERDTIEGPPTCLSITS
jgi:chromosome segregation ATPase